jgi:hypothetical protein
LPWPSKPTTNGPLIEASVAGPPSPDEFANPFPTTVVIVPIGSLGGVDDVAALGSADRPVRSADVGSDPEQAVLPSASARRAARAAMEADVRFGPLQSRCFLMALPPQSISNPTGPMSAMQLVSGGAVGASIQLALIACEHPSMNPG